MRDDFSFEDTAPDGKPLKRGRRLTFTAFIRDIIALAMLVFVLYFLYFAGYTYYRYDYMKEKVRNAALYATKTDDDRKSDEAITVVAKPKAINLLSFIKYESPYIIYLSILVKFY